MNELCVYEQAGLLWVPAFVFGPTSKLFAKITNITINIIYYKTTILVTNFYYCSNISCFLTVVCSGVHDAVSIFISWSTVHRHG